jgi:hypothetical protein
MKVIGLLSIALLLQAAALAYSQVDALPASPTPAADYASCPSFGSTTPSAWQTRCGTQSRNGDLLDGGRQLFGSIGIIAGNDSAFNARKDLPATFEGTVASGGFISQKPKSVSLIENTASLVNYHTAESTLEYMNSTTVSLSRMPSVRSAFTFDMNNTFGNNAIRILQLGGTTTGEDASYGVHAGTILNNQATFRYSRQTTDTRWWSVSVRNNFRDFIDEHSRVNTVHGRAEIQYQPSERAGIGIFQETSVQTGVVDCGSLSLGVVYERRLLRSMAAEASAAPAFGSKGCTSRISANLYGAFSAEPARSSTLWVSGFRKVNDSDFASISYETNAQGGIMQRFGQDAWLTAHGGWIGGVVPSKVAPFQGLYFASTFGHALPRGLMASVSVQAFRWDGVPNVAPTRTIVSGSIYWSPSRTEPDQPHGPMAH